MLGKIEISKHFMIFTFVSFVFSACQKEKRITMLRTDSINEVSYTSAHVNAHIIDLSDNISHDDYGFCYGTSANPTIENNIVSLGKVKSKGDYSSPISDLKVNTNYYVRSFILEGEKYIYGNSIGFITKTPTVPTIITIPISNITLNTCNVGGNVLGDNGASVSSRGVCWSVQAQPFIVNSYVISGSGTGEFLNTIYGLSKDSIYYFRAFATNSVGIAYGDIVSFSALPVITTNSISNITYNTAIGGGNITYPGGSNIISQGVCWSLTTNPTINDSKTIDGNTVGNYISNLTGLAAGTSYFVKAYATNALGTAYGNAVNFSTVDTLPTVTSDIVSNISTTSATCGGNVLINGGTTITARGVCWSTLPNPTVANLNKTNDGSGIGVFYSQITGLAVNTTYYVRAYASNSAGTSYGVQRTFTTLQPTLPIIANVGVISGITPTTAIGGGSVVSTGNATVTARGSCWSTTQNPTTSNFKTIDGSGVGNFTSNLTGLIGGTTYYVRAYATNSVGTAYGAQISFNLIGANYAGGIVFYVDGSGNHGLIAASSDQGSFEWGCQGTLINSTASTFGAGQSNTNAIIGLCTTTTNAASICSNLVSNGYSDWYLPSKNELEVMYINRSIIGGFSTYYYWSSTEFNGNVAPGPGTYAYQKYFLNGSSNYDYKMNSFKVRAIRSF